MLPITSTRLLLAASIAALVGFGSYIAAPNLTTTLTDMKIEPAGGTLTVGDTIVVEIIVSSQQPVNVFQGLVTFDPNIVSIKQIDYNTSIADLWAELPWYSNGDGTLHFAGGTTAPGGFIGSGSLIQITFLTKNTGKATIDLAEARVLKHDGLGSDAQLGVPLDAVFAIKPDKLAEKTVLKKTESGPQLTVLSETPSTDLNGDGVHSILDISIFMRHLATQNKLSDCNGDGAVNLADLSILNQS